MSEEKVSSEILQDKIKLYKNQIKNRIDFLSFEGLILKDGSFKGALFEGVDMDALKKNPFFVKRLIQGSLPEGENFVIVGKSLAEDLNLQIASPVPVIVPGSGHSSSFSRRQQMFTVGAIADFGRHILNSRYVLMPLTSGQFLKQQKGSLSGTRLWLKDANQGEKNSSGPQEKKPSFYCVLLERFGKGFF